MSALVTLLLTATVLDVLLMPDCGAEEEVVVVRLQRMDKASYDSYIDSGNNALPDLPQWTLCVRLRLFHLVEFNTIFSYTTGEHYQEIVLGIDWPQSLLRLECCKYKGFLQMQVPFRLYTWHHLCVSADMTQDAQYMVFDDKVHEALIRRPGVTPEQLYQVRGGGRFLLGQNWNPSNDFMFIEAMHGDLADFRFLNTSLPLKDLQAFTSCRAQTHFSSLLYEFDENMTSLQVSGDSEVYSMSLEDICLRKLNTIMIVPERVDFDKAATLCGYFTGVIAVPTNSDENVDIYDSLEQFNNHCTDSWGTTFWYGLRANLSQKWWTRTADDLPLSWHNFYPGWEYPNDDYRCVAVGAINMKYVWAASPCDIGNCPVCNLTSTPTIHLRGLCKLSKFDHFYFPHGYLNLKPVFEGTFLSRITWDNGTWLIKSRLDEGIVARMASKVTHNYPFGLHYWDVRGDSCPHDRVPLLLTSCERDEFTCSDGTCISKTKRCDQVVDCPDTTDELNCDIITFPEGYSAEIAPPAVDDPKLSLSISLDITSVRRFDILGFKLAVDIIQSVKWKDPRLILKNLLPGDFPNEAKLSKNIWLPDVLVKDGFHSPTDRQMRRVRLLIRRDSGPLPDDDAHYSEDELFSGGRSTVKLVQQYTVTAMCQFQLHTYPFDSQRCSLVFSMPDQSHGKIWLLQDGVLYRGQRRLLEYELVNETFTPIGNISAHVKLQLVFRNQYGYYIGNAVVPSLLMSAICYLTFFFDLHDFTDRIMVSLTSLLVLAALFTQTSQSIPKTAYLKLIDIWYVTLIATDFIIIVTVVVIENQRMRDTGFDTSLSLTFRNPPVKVAPVETSNCPSEGTHSERTLGFRHKFHTAIKLNSVSQVVFPVLASVGFFFWVVLHMYLTQSSQDL